MLANKSHVGSRYASYVLIVLTLVYVFNFIDRQIVSILAEDLKSDLRVTDAQLGILSARFCRILAMFGIAGPWLMFGREDR